MGGKCKQIDISTHTQTQTIFVYLSTEVKPSMAVMTPFHTSTNTIYLGWVLVSCWGAFFALNISCLLSVSVYLIKSPLCLFTENDKKNKGISCFFFNAVNFLYKNVPTLWSGQASVLMSFFCFPSFWERRRLQIGQGWWEDYDLPDGTLCVLVSWQSDPTEYWDETPAWVFRKKVWNFLESVYWSVTFCIGSEERF